MCVHHGYVSVHMCLSVGVYGVKMDRSCNHMPMSHFEITSIRYDRCDECMKTILALLCNVRT